MIAKVHKDVVWRSYHTLRWHVLVRGYIQFGSPRWEAHVYCGSTLVSHYGSGWMRETVFVAIQSARRIVMWPIRLHRRMDHVHLTAQERALSRIQTGRKVKPV